MDLQSIKNVEIQHTPKLPSALALELISLAVQERKRISARRIVETIIAFAKPFNLNPKRCQKVFEIVPSLRAGWTRRGSNVPKRKKESDDGSDRGWRSPDRAAGHTLQRYVQPCSAPFLSNLSRPHSKKKKTKGSEPQESSRDSLSSVRLTCLHRQHHSFDSYKASFAHGSPFTCHYVRRKSRMLAVTRNRPRHCALRCWLRSLRGHFPFLFAIGSAQITEVGDWDADDDGASGYTDRCQERKRGSRCR